MYLGLTITEWAGWYRAAVFEFDAPSRKSVLRHEVRWRVGRTPETPLGLIAEAQRRLVQVVGSGDRGIPAATQPELTYPDGT